jgi:LMBR1 domain-containing protein 1
MDAQAFAEAQQSLRYRVNELVEIGELIKTERHERQQAGLTQLSRFSLNGDKRALAKEEREALLQFKQAVYLLEEDVQDFKDATTNYQNANPLWPYLALLLGFVCFIISIFWFIHVIVYVYPSPPLAVSMWNTRVPLVSFFRVPYLSFVSLVSAAFPQCLFQVV